MCVWAKKLIGWIHSVRDSSFYFTLSCYPEHMVSSLWFEILTPAPLFHISGSRKGWGIFFPSKGTSWKMYFYHFIQFSSVAQLCLTLCDPIDCSIPGLPVHHQLPEFAQTHVHWVGDAIQLSHPLSSPSPPTFNLSKHQGLFQWVSSSHQVAKVLEFQLQHQSFQWTLRTDLL